MRLGLDEINVS